MQFVPMILTAVQSSTIMQGIATTVGVVSSLSQGYAASAQAKAEARAAERNARIVRQQASVREDALRLESRQRLGEQRAAAVQSGFDPNTGSLLELQGDSAGALEFDALSTRYEGTLQALSFEQQARNARAQARMAVPQGYLNAAGSLFGSLGRYGGGGRINQAPVETRTPRPVGFQGYGGRY